MGRGVSEGNLLLFFGGSKLIFDIDDFSCTGAWVPLGVPQDPLSFIDTSLLIIFSWFTGLSKLLVERQVWFDDTVQFSLV